MITETQVRKALEDLLGYDAIEALLLTADERGDVTLLARGTDGPVPVTLESSRLEAVEARFSLTIGKQS
jgi:hypothetical protein